VEAPRGCDVACEGERKQVTVVFADVKGSMELAERLDPADFSSRDLGQPRGHRHSLARGLCGEIGTKSAKRTVPRVT